MSKNFDSYDLLRARIAATQVASEETADQNQLMLARKKKLLDLGIPEIVVLEVIKAEFDPDYIENSIRLEFAKKIFNGKESLASPPFLKR